MRNRLTVVLLAVATGAGAYTLLASAQTHQHGMTAPSVTATDVRELVKFPEPMRVHTIANMRDHLLALQEINEALSNNAFDQASSIAEQRLGMSSLGLHGAHELAPYLPQCMQDIGTERRAGSPLQPKTPVSAMMCNPPLPHSGR